MPFTLHGSTKYFNPSDYPKLSFCDVQEGDQLVELANPGNPWGRIAIRAGLGDALKKGVPVCQHTGVIVLKDGQLYVQEALTFISENKLAKKDGWYVVLRLNDTRRNEIIRKGIVWGRSKLGSLWGVRNALRTSWNLLWAWTGYHWDAPESDSLMCSNRDAEFWDKGGHPVYKDGTDDDEVKPWDFLTPEIRQHFHIIGTLDLS